MTCFCDVRVGGHSNSKVLYDAHNPEVRGTFKGCRAGTNECPDKCWHEVRKAVPQQSVLNHMCRDYYTVGPPNGIPLIGYVEVSNCGTHKSYIYPQKLCCYYHVIPFFNPPRVIRYGYLC